MSENFSRGKEHDYTPTHTEREKDMLIFLFFPGHIRYIYKMINSATLRLLKVEEEDEERKCYANKRMDFTSNFAGELFRVPPLPSLSICDSFPQPLSLNPRTSLFSGHSQGDKNNLTGHFFVCVSSLSPLFPSPPPPLLL